MYLYIIFKDKKSKRCHKTVEIKVFLLYLLNDRRIRLWIQSRIRIRIHTSRSGRPKTRESGGSGSGTLRLITGNPHA